MVAEQHAFPLGGFDAAAHAVRGPAFTKPQHFVDVAVVPQSNGAAPIIKVTHAFYVHECLHNKLHYTFNGIDRSWNTVFTGPATLNELKARPHIATAPSLRACWSGTGSVGFVLTASRANTLRTSLRRTTTW